MCSALPDIHLALGEDAIEYRRRAALLAVGRYGVHCLNPGIRCVLAADVIMECRDENPAGAKPTNQCIPHVNHSRPTLLALCPFDISLSRAVSLPYVHSSCYCGPLLSAHPILFSTLASKE